jgi:formylglycine-generating enzyme required for sulfatase activity
MDMIFCPPGTFTMGSPTSETGRGGDETQHQVTLTNGFYLGKYEVTQAQYEAVMTGNSEGLNAKPSRWPNNIDRPVEMVSWNDAQVFLSLLNDMEENAGRLPAGWKYVLPTEAQWEYACRAGTTTAYSWGNDINSSRANFILSGFSQTRDVGLYDANPWGFFDMHGNVYEWVYDWHAVYASSSQVNPEGPASGSYRVVRGGCWYGGGMEMRSANRPRLFLVNLQYTLDWAFVLHSNPCQSIRRIPNWNCSVESPSRARRAKPGRSLALRPTMRGTEISPIRSWSRVQWI